jgi:hypothetical protein
MLKALTRAETSALVFAAAIGLFYGLLPFAVGKLVLENEYFHQLAQVSAVAVVGILLGSCLPVLDGLNALPKRTVRLKPFLLGIWGAFLLFVVVLCVTADRIPFIAALQGADPETLVVLRERFLKAREGWQSSFAYINAVLAGALVPYSLAVMLLRRYRHRWLFFGFFLLYCISFVEKVFFLKAAIPLLYVIVQRRISSVIRPRVVIAGALGVLALVTLASGVGTRGDESRADGEFFSTSFATDGPAAFLLWRAVAVPMVTAADALRVFVEQYDGMPLMGASNSLIAAILGRERVNIERDVFAAQWGQAETGTGNANAVFVTEAFLNFGYPGVVAFSLIVGLILRFFGRSSDEALRSLWLLFCWGVFVGPLTGTLLSTGFLPVMLLSALVRIEGPPESSACQPPGLVPAPTP